MWKEDGNMLYFCAGVAERFNVDQKTTVFPQHRVDESASGGTCRESVFQQSALAATFPLKRRKMSGGEGAGGEETVLRGGRKKK